MKQGRLVALDHIEAMRRRARQRLDLHLAGPADPFDMNSAVRTKALRGSRQRCERCTPAEQGFSGGRRETRTPDLRRGCSVAAKWIAETQRTRKQLERQLGEQVPGGKLTKDQVRALVAELRGIVDVLADAEPADKSDLCSEMGLKPTYNPDGTIAVVAMPRGRTVRVGGGTCPADTPPIRWAIGIR